jgi:hypothetical protein
MGNRGLNLNTGSVNAPTCRSCRDRVLQRLVKTLQPIIRRSHAQ